MAHEAAIVMVYVTIPDEATADSLAKLAIGQRLAACVNLLGPIRSYYEWQGDMQTSTEIALLFKTTPDRLDALRAALSSAHPYECPCIVALPVTHGAASFLDWVRLQTRPIPPDA